MTSAACEAIEAEFSPCGEPAPYSTTRDGHDVALCAEHAVHAVEAFENVIGPTGHAVRFDHISSELWEVSQS